MTTWVLLAGLPATGKSTLARALAGRLDAAILDKDRVRDVLFPGALTDHSGEQAQVCVDAMLQAAAYLTSHNGAKYIFFDGRTFSSAAQIEEVVDAAEHAGARWRILHLVCKDSVAHERLQRADPTHPAQNRDVALYRDIQQRFEPIVRPKLLVETSDGVESLLDPVEKYLHSWPGGAWR